jgi:hypothetical protein
LVKVPAVPGWWCGWAQAPNTIREIVEWNYTNIYIIIYIDTKNLKPGIENSVFLEYEKWYHTIDVMRMKHPAKKCQRSRFMMRQHCFHQLQVLAESIPQKKTWGTSWHAEGFIWKKQSRQTLIDNIMQIIKPPPLFKNLYIYNIYVSH